MEEILERASAAGLSNDLMALIKRRVLQTEGDLRVFMANLRYFKEALAILRRTETQS